MADRVNTTSSHGQPAELFSPSKSILLKHRHKLSSWDSFICEQQAQLASKKDSLQSLEVKLAKIALCNINDKCSKVQQWESSKRHQFDKEQQRMALRTERLEQQQMHLGNERLELQQTKAGIKRQRAQLNAAKIDVVRREHAAREMQSLNESTKQRLLQRATDSERVQSECAQLQSELRATAEQYAAQLAETQRESERLAALNAALQSKEQQYTRYVDEHGERMGALQQRERAFGVERAELNAAISSFEKLRAEQKAKEAEMEAQHRALCEQSAKLELWSNELRDFEHELEKKRVDLIQEKNRINRLFDSFGAAPHMR